MDTDLLKCLVELSGNEVGNINLDAFYSRCGKSTGILNALDALRKRGYISTAYYDDDLKYVCVNRQAIDYVRRLRPM